MRRSTSTHTQRLLWLFAFMALIAFAVLAGCEKAEEPQHLNNPFDPASSDAGDGLHLTAKASTNQVFLSWNQPQNLNISEYVIYRSDTRDGTYEDLAIVLHTNSEFGNHVFNYPAPSQPHWFKVQAFTANGDFSLVTLAVAAFAEVGPSVVVGDTVATLATRFPVLTVTIGFGDSLMVSTNEVFTNALRLPAAAHGVPLTINNFDLGPAAATDTFDIYVRSFDHTGFSMTSAIKNLRVNFLPLHSFVGASNLHLARRINDLAIPSLGVVRMRFAPSVDELAGAEWQAGTDTLFGYELKDTAAGQEIWAEYEGDFGFTVMVKLAARPDLLTSATFELKLPTNRVVSNLTVVADFKANATDFRLSESPILTGVPWQAYNDTTSFQLSPTAGTKTVYAQFRNDWTQSDVLSDYCTYISQGPDVKILVPAADSILLGGSTITLRGTSSPGSEYAAVDSVGLDLGDGAGFHLISTSETWQEEWTVPTFDYDTDVILRARVWVGDDQFTDVVTVTVTQLAINFTAPANGSTFSTHGSLVISGNASGVLNGVPLDSVTVDIEAEHLLAEGTDSWSLTWQPPIVTETTDFNIIATAWADGETAVTTTTVTLTP